MQNPDIFGTPHRSSRTRDRLVLWLTIFLCVASLIVAGALGAAVRTGGTGIQMAYVVVQTLGNIVVNGVQYDDSQANIIVDGVPNQPRSALRPGMVVEVEGELNYASGAGSVTVAHTNRAILGQVEGINAANGELRVLAQRVTADNSTHFDGAAGISQLAAGDWVAVHGLDDPARNTFAATLIELVAPPAQAISEIRGVVRNSRDGGFRIGGLDVISAAGVVDDNFVAVKGLFDAGTASLLATAVRMTPEVVTREDVDTELEGFIGEFRSRKDFTVAGVAIDAGQASFSDGTANDLVPGARISVEGIVRNGVLIAEEIEFHTAAAKSGGSNGSSGSTGSSTPGKSAIEVEGTVSEFRAISDFVVKGRRIDASNASIHIAGKRAPAVGQKAQVKGHLLNDGSIDATSVEFEKP